MKFKLPSGPDVPNWIMAIMSVSALVVSVVALRQTATSNRLAQLMYEKNEKPLFRVRTECPENFVASNKYEKALVRRVKLTNEGAPVGEVNFIEHIPLLHLAVFDRNRPELSPHMANKIILRSFYEDGRFFYDSIGEIYSAESTAKQRAIAQATAEYARSHPDLVCEVYMFDLFKIGFTDSIGQRCVRCLLQGCETTPDSFDRLRNEAASFTEKARKSAETLNRLFDYCYELSKTENQTDPKSK